MLDKKQVASQFKQTADLLELLEEEPFRIKAFKNASRHLEAFKGNFRKFYEEKRLEEISGIGKSLADEIYGAEGSNCLPILAKLIAQIPNGVLELFSVSGLGAKKIRDLWYSNIDSLEKLIEAGEEGTLTTLKGFGEKSAQSIVKAAKFAIKTRNRFRLDEMTAIADQFISIFKRKSPKARIELAGSLRRCCETIGDIDLVVTNISFAETEAVLQELADIELATPPTLKFNYSDYPFELIVTTLNNFGATLALWTGNSKFKQTLLDVAEEKGYTLSAEEGLKNSKGELASSEESILFKHLGLPFLAPELRETTTPKYISNLIENKDIQGLIHNHSTWSDGEHNILEMLEAAQNKGYKYLGLADHSFALAIANGLNADRVYAQAQEIKRIRESLKATGNNFGLLHGIEVDILPDGSLAYPDNVLAFLDYTVISVHQNFSLSREEQTQRIIKAMQNPYAHILGHPTGRLLLKRPAYAVDIIAILEACASSGTIIEINANPRRLDLDWRYVMKAKELGCKFAINPDAHSINGFNVIPFGVKIARKGGLAKEDVVNTASTAEGFLNLLKK